MTIQKPLLCSLLLTAGGLIVNAQEPIEIEIIDLGEPTTNETAGQTEFVEAAPDSVNTETSEPVLDEVVEVEMAAPAIQRVSVPEPEPSAPPPPPSAESIELTLEEVGPASNASAEVGEIGEPLILDVDLSGAGVDFPSVPTESLEGDGSSEKISVDFPEEDVRNIIRNVADLYDLNVIIPDALQGSTSLRLQNVTWEQVFEAVLQPVGYTHVEDKNIIKIKSLADLEKEPVITRIFDIDYAVASQLQASVAPLVDASAGGRIQVDGRSNKLIIKERPSRMNDIQSIIDLLDRPTEQVMIESKFVQVDNSDTESLGIDWSGVTAGRRLTAGPFERSWDQEYTQTRENETTSEKETGFDLGAGGPVDTDTNGVTNTLTNTFDLTRSTTAVFSSSDFTVILNALENYADTRIVNNPTIVTLDGEEAKILIGEKYPVPSYTYNQERGTFEVSGFEFEDIGIVLTVKPQVNSGGFIRLDVAPQISRRSQEAVTFGDAQTNIPIIETTETRSSVTLKDGYTLAIGGLIQQEESNSNTSVPFISDIPLLGELFSSDAQGMRETNLIIFVTAKTLNPDGTTYREIVDPRVLAKMGILESELPGFELPEEQLEVLEEMETVRNQADRDKAILKFRAELDALEKANEARSLARRESDEDADARMGRGNGNLKEKMPRSRAR